ncbi:MAG: helix-turn-helix domain-containing protein [Pseudomonadota bacterium]
MSDLSDPLSKTETPDTGLRSRKKAQRRQDILSVAGRLFNDNGFDATTMVEIAESTGVSPPTVFNYFGSKENILSALLFEGTARVRVEHLAQRPREDQPFVDILTRLLCELTENTMRIAGKRVWRYAESANIRRVGTEFQKQFAELDFALLRLIRAYLGDYTLVLRCKQPADYDFLAQMVYDLWTARYFEFIKDDSMTIEAHYGRLREDVATWVDMLFDDAVAQATARQDAEAQR